MTSDAIVAVFTLAALLAGAILSVRTVVIGRASRRWPAVEGRVVALEVVTIQRGRQGSATYRPAISYQYAVRGRQYQGSRIRVSNRLLMDMHFGSQEEARAVLDGYYPRSPATVYFDPESPRYSVLQPGVSRAQYLAAVLLVVGGTAVAGLFWFAFFGQEMFAK